MHVFVRHIARATAEGTGAGRRIAASGQKRTHVQPNQLLWLNSDEVSQRPINAPNVAPLVMRNDEVGNRVKDLDPVAVLFLHSRGEKGILKRDPYLPGGNAKKKPPVLVERAAPTSAAQLR